MFLYANNVELYRADLLKPVNRAYNSITKNEAKSCSHKLKAVFEQWKTELGEEPPKKHWLQGSANTSNDAAPFRYAGYGVSNYTDLAFKLMLDSYEPFDEICRLYETPVVFAVLYNDIDTAQIDSLVRLSCFLYELQTRFDKLYIEALIKGGVKSKKGVSHKLLKGLDSGGRAKGVESNMQRSRQHKTAWRKVAIDMFSREPSSSYAQVAFYILSKTTYNVKNRKTGEKYSESTVISAISGTKKEALKQLSQS